MTKLVKKTMMCIVLGALLIHVIPSTGNCGVPATYEVYMYDFTKNLEMKISPKRIISLIHEGSPSLSIYEDKVIWYSNVDMVTGITIHNISAGTITRLETRFDSSIFFTSEAVIFGEWVIWSGCNNSIKDIYAHNLYTNESFLLTADPALQARPAIYGNVVVWEDNRDGNFNIYMYNLSSRTERQITNHTANQTMPRIYSNKIVWCDSRYGNLDIFMYDIIKGVETQITNDPSNQTAPDIYADIIVWQDDRNGNWDIFYYNLSLGKEEQITTGDGVETHPHIYEDKVVWQSLNWLGNEAYSLDIYSYNLSAKNITPVCENPAAQYNPQIYGNYVVWYDERNPMREYFGDDILYIILLLVLPGVIIIFVVCISIWLVKKEG